MFLNEYIPWSTRAFGFISHHFRFQSELTVGYHGVLDSVTHFLESYQVFLDLLNVLLSWTLSKGLSKILKFLVEDLELFVDIQVLIPLAHEFRKENCRRLTFLLSALILLRTIRTLLL